MTQTLSTEESIRRCYQMGVSIEDLIADYGKKKVKEVLEAITEPSQPRSRKNLSISRTRQFRKLHREGMTGKDIAEKFGLSPATVSRLLKRKKSLVNRKAKAA